MRIHSLFTLQKLSKVREVSAYILLEALAAITITGLSLAALIKLDFRGKQLEKEINRKFREELKDESLTNGPCQEEMSFDNLRLISCGKTKYKKYYISGFSTLELAIAILITIPCLLSMAELLNLNAKNLNQTKQEKTASYNTLRIYELLNEITKEADSHTFPILPKVHPKGQIRFTDGNPNPIIKSNGSSRPNSDSDAITYLRMNVLDTLEVISNNTEIYACPRYRMNVDLNIYKNVMLLGPDGFFEAKLINSQSTYINGKSCFYSNPSVTQSILGSPKNRYKQIFIKYIIPIERLYTFYVDRKNSLRYLGHIGEINIENQPILDKSPELKLKVTLLPSNLFIINAFLKFNKNLQELNLTNRLARASILNFLLNRP